VNVYAEREFGGPLTYTSLVQGKICITDSPSCSC